MGNAPLRKVLSYRDLAGMTLEDHTAHWEGFVWQAGPVVVTHEGGPWGKVQVWAATRTEGERVIRHAADIAGVDVDCAKCEWVVHLAQNSRYGRTGRMIPKPLRGGGISVTMRMGPSGLPEIARPATDL